MVLFQILLDGPEPRDAGTTYSCLLQSAGGEASKILLASVLSSMRIICPNRVSRRGIHQCVIIKLCSVVSGLYPSTDKNDVQA